MRTLALLPRGLTHAPAASCRDLSSWALQAGLVIAYACAAWALPAILPSWEYAPRVATLHACVFVAVGCLTLLSLRTLSPPSLFPFTPMLAAAPLLCVMFFTEQRHVRLRAPVPSAAGSRYLPSFPLSPFPSFFALPRAGWRASPMRSSFWAWVLSPGWTMTRACYAQCRCWPPQRALRHWLLRCRCCGGGRRVTSAEPRSRRRPPRLRASRAAPTASRAPAWACSPPATSSAFPLTLMPPIARTLLRCSAGAMATPRLAAAAARLRRRRAATPFSRAPSSAPPKGGRFRQRCFRCRVKQMCLMRWPRRRRPAARLAWPAARRNFRGLWPRCVRVRRLWRAG